MSEIHHPKFHYDAEDITLYLNFGEYGRQIELAYFSGDGTKLLTVKEVGVALIWDVDSRKLLQEIHPTSCLAGKEEASPLGSEFVVFIESVALNKDGSLALLGLNDGTAGIFSTQNGTRLSTFYPPNTKTAEQWGVIRAVNFSPDGSLALVGFDQRSVGVWRVQDNALVQFLSGLHSKRLFGKPFVRDTLVSSVAASQDNRFVFAGFADMTATIWRIEDKEVICDATHHVEKIIGLWVGRESVCWATTGGRILEEGDNQNAVQRLVTGESWQEVAFSPDGKTFLVRSVDGSIKHWSLDGKSKNLGQAFSHLSDRAKTIAFGRTKKVSLYVEGENQVNIITPKSSVQVKRDSRIDGFILSPQDDLLATYGWSDSVELWKIQTNECLHVLNHKETVSTVAFSSDGNLLAVGVIGMGGAGTIRPVYVWNTKTGTLLCELNGHNHQIHALAFGPNDDWLVSASLDRTVRIWRIDHITPSNSSELTQLRYEDLEFDNIAVLSDGRIVVFRSGLLEVWHNQQKLEIPVPHYFENQWHITEDEAYILGSFDEQVVIKWSLDTGQQVKVYRDNIIRPETLPNSTFIMNNDSFHPTAGCYLWRTEVGVFTHIGDGPRGWATPITLSANNRTTVIPGLNDAAMIELDEPQRVVSFLPFEGKLRATCILEDRVLMINSAGRLFINKGSA